MFASSLVRPALPDASKNRAQHTSNHSPFEIARAVQCGRIELRAKAGPVIQERGRYNSARSMAVGVSIHVSPDHESA